MKTLLLPRALRGAAPAAVALALALTLGLPAAAAGPEAANKALVREFYDVVLNGLDFSAVGRFVAPGATDLDRESIEHLETFRRQHVPDLSYVIEDMVAEGGTVVVRLRETGTHTGAAQGIPATGDAIDLPAVAIYRVADGKIQERWYLDDKLKLARAMGFRVEKPGS